MDESFQIRFRNLAEIVSHELPTSPQIEREVPRNIDVCDLIQTIAIESAQPASCHERRERTRFDEEDLATIWTCITLFFIRIYPRSQARRAEDVLTLRAANAGRDMCLVEWFITDVARLDRHKMIGDKVRFGGE